MTLREAAEQALECCGDMVNGWESLAPLAVRQAAIESLDALRAALAEPDWSVTGASMMDAKPFDPPSEEYLRQKIADWKKAHGDKSKGEP